MFAHFCTGIGGANCFGYFADIDVLVDGSCPYGLDP